MNSYFTKPTLINGVKKDYGKHATGFILVGKIKNIDWLNGLDEKNCFCKTDEQIRERANYEWQFNYQGMFKELIIKKDGVVLDCNENYSVNKYGDKSFKKKVKKKKH